MKLKAVIFFLCALLFAASLHAAETPDFNFSNFRMIPVLHEGRIKPLDTYARIKLREFAGKEAIDGLEPEYWLAETFFDPATAATRRIFAIHDADLKSRLHLKESQTLFSLADLQAPLQKTMAESLGLLQTPQENLTAEQKDLLHLNENVLDDEQLLRTFSLILPLNAPIPNAYQSRLHLNADDPIAYLRLYKSEPAIMKDVADLVKRKGENPDHYTSDEKSLAMLAFSLRQIRAGGDNNDDFKIIPATWSKNPNDWISPWALTINGEGGPDSANVIKNWQSLATAFRAGDAQAWNAAAQAAYKETPQRKGFSLNSFRLEILYNQIKPFTAALILYGLSLIFACITIFQPKRRLHKNAAPFMLTAGVIFHIFGVISRVIILSRPPVGTLYEAILFVSALCATTALGFFWRKKNIIDLIPGLAAAFALLLIAPTTLQQGESMEMLVAVLNTNFWLATHVLCITTGYATSIMCACLAHAWLILKLKKPNAKILTDLRRNIYLVSLAALFFTAVGTALGGIWADQSWGRFWGWDPKENGALLIVLWLIWLQHGRASGKLNQLAFTSAAAFLNVIVAIAWFGVNLLSVGLHSYGFTSGIAAGLAIFCAAETILIATLSFLIYKKTSHAH